MLEVTFQKLLKYCDSHGGYEIIESAPDQVDLIFVPSFPEAIEKAETEGLPRIMLHGRVNDGRISFFRVEYEDVSGIHEKNLDDAELTYRSWLEFIEENY